MKVFYCDHHAVDLPPGHRFPMGKYRSLRERLVREGVLRADELLEAPLASRGDVAMAHDDAYIDAVFRGTLDVKQVRRIGFPWSGGLVRRSLASVGGALASADAALDEGIGGNLAGGTHHAFSDAGEGFCVFNDLAVVSLSLRAAERVARIAVVDLDVHQGNGSASILGGRDDVFVFSMHGEKNFPFRKVPSTLDVALPDDATDEMYLEALERSLRAVFEFGPELVLYQAGVDPLDTDRLGRLALTHRGLADRDAMVFSACRRHGAPVAVALGGGYADPIEHTVTANVNTYRAAKAAYA